MPRTAEKTPKNALDRRDASPKRKLKERCKNTKKNEFVPFVDIIRENTSINPAAVVEQLDKASSEAEKSKILKDWRVNLYQFFADNNAPDLFKMYMCQRALCCENEICDYPSSNKPEDIKKAMEDATFVPVCTVPRGHAFVPSSWHLMCSESCLTSHRLYKGHYLEGGPAFSFGNHADNIFNRTPCSHEEQKALLAEMQMDLWLVLEDKHKEGNGLVRAQGYGHIYICENDTELTPIVCVESDRHGGALYFTARPAYPVDGVRRVTFPPFDMIGDITLAEITWLATFGDCAQIVEDEEPAEDSPYFEICYPEVEEDSYDCGYSHSYDDDSD